MTCQEIYDITMALMDEMLDTGAVDYNSTKDYTARTPGILSILQTEVVMELKSVGAKIDSLNVLGSMNAEVDLEDDICVGVLTYGLAARLLGQEDSTLSSYFSRLYQDGMGKAKDTYEGKYIGKQKSRENVYGLFRAGD